MSGKKVVRQLMQYCRNNKVALIHNVKSSIAKINLNRLLMYPFLQTHLNVEPSGMQWLLLTQLTWPTTHGSSLSVNRTVLDMNSGLPNYTGTLTIGYQKTQLGKGTRGIFGRLVTFEEFPAMTL